MKYTENEDFKEFNVLSFCRDDIRNYIGGEFELSDEKMWLIAKKVGDELMTDYLIAIREAIIQVMTNHQVG